MWGQRSPLSVGNLLQPRLGEVIGNVNLRLWRYGVLGGRVLDDRGDPVVSVLVALLEENPTSGVPEVTLSRVPYQVTDDRGEYRFSELIPGKYYVALPGVDVLPDRSHQAQPALTTFYPGVTNPGVAEAVQLAAGALQSGIDIRILDRTFSGSVIGDLGYTDGVGTWQLELLPRSSQIRTALDARQLTVPSHGHFRFDNVEPGDYLVRAVAFLGWGNVLYSRPGVTMWIPGKDMTLPLPSDEPTWSAEETLTVQEGRPTILKLKAAVAGRIMGRVVFDGLSEAPSLERLAKTPIFSEPIDGRMLTGMSSARIAMDGQFFTSGLPSGRYYINVYAIPGWYLEEVEVNGIVSADDTIDHGNGNTSGVVIRFTDQPTVLAGSVVHDGQPRAHVPVFVFPTDRRVWTRYRGRLRRYVETLSDSRGRYRIEGLPRGSYHLVAFDQHIDGQWLQPNNLTRMAAVATTVEVRRRTNLERHLKLVYAR
jgi:hypothetical protein